MQFILFDTKVHKCYIDRVILDRHAEDTSAAYSLTTIFVGPLYTSIYHCGYSGDFVIKRLTPAQ